MRECSDKRELCPEQECNVSRHFRQALPSCYEDTGRVGEMNSDLQVIVNIALQ